MHSRVLYGRQSLNRSGQFPFKPPLEGQTLLKLRHAKAVGVHLLKSGNRSLGQAKAGQLKAGVVHFVCWDHDGTATFGVLVRDVHRGQLGNDGAAVFFGQVGVQHAPIGLAAHHQSQYAHRNQQRHACGQAQLGALVHPFPALT